MTEQPFTPTETELVDGYRSKKVTHNGWTYHPTLSRTEVRRGLAQVKRDAWEEGAQHGSRSPGYYPDENPYGHEETP